MSGNSSNRAMLPEQQEAIRARCFHPTGVFSSFPGAALDLSVSYRFEEIARKYADRTAVETSTESATFADLNQWSNRVARSLIAQRGTKSEPVALHIGSPVFAVAAHLGVLKAGKMSLFVDPARPLSRRRQLMEDSQAGSRDNEGRTSSSAGRCTRRGLLVARSGPMNVSEGRDHDPPKWPRSFYASNASLAVTRSTNWRLRWSSFPRTRPRSAWPQKPGGAESN